jgi:hypothetical protein
MHDTNPMRKISIERLSFGARARAGGGVADVTEADVPPQINHVMCLKHVLDETVIFAEVETAAFGGDDAGSVLTTVLQDSEAVENALIDLGIFVG